jgi:hypothetical protein
VKSDPARAPFALIILADPRIIGIGSAGQGSALTACGRQKRMRRLQTPAACRRMVWVVISGLTCLWTGIRSDTHPRVEQRDA